MEIVNRSWFPGFVGVGMNRQSAKDFQDIETILFDTTVVHTYHYTFNKTHRLYNTNREF